jgi:hypothetical protein
MWLPDHSITRQNEPDYSRFKMTSSPFYYWSVNWIVRPSFVCFSKGWAIWLPELKKCDNQMTWEWIRKSSFRTLTVYVFKMYFSGYAIEPDQCPSTKTHLIVGGLLKFTFL